MSGNPWPDLHTTLLRQMWRTHSAAEISTFLRAVGGDYSRDAVAGKARRLRLEDATLPPRTSPGYITLGAGHYYEPRRHLVWHHRPPGEPPRTDGRGQYEYDFMHQPQGSGNHAATNER